MDTTMTVYDMSVSPTTLSRSIPSTQLVTEICLHICARIIRYYSDVLMASSPTGQRMLANHITMLQWYLGILGRTTSDTTHVDHTFTVHFIYLEKLDETDHLHKHRFTLDTLHKICPKLLLESMTQLLQNSLSCIKPRLPMLSVNLFDNCCDRATDVIQDLTFLVNHSSSKERSCLCQVTTPELRSFRIILEVHDQNRVIEFTE